MDKLYSLEYLENYLTGNAPKGETPIERYIAKQLLDTMREVERLRTMLSIVDSFATTAWDFGSDVTDRGKMVYLGWSILKIKEAANGCSFAEAIKQFLEKYDQPTSL